MQLSLEPPMNESHVAREPDAAIAVQMPIGALLPPTWFQLVIVQST